MKELFSLITFVISIAGGNGLADEFNTESSTPQLVHRKETIKRDNLSTRGSARKVANLQNNIPFTGSFQKYDPRDLRGASQSADAMVKPGKYNNRGPTGGSKSGKPSKEDYTAYYIAPISCPNSCVVASNSFNIAIVPCNNTSSQLWTVHEDVTFVKFESYSYPETCISLKNQAECTTDSELVLEDCDDPESNWYFTGGEIASEYCWSHGMTSMMGVQIPVNSQTCDSKLYSYQGQDSYLYRSDLFMFINEKSAMGSQDVTIAGLLDAPTPSP